MSAERLPRTVFLGSDGTGTLKPANSQAHQAQRRPAEAGRVSSIYGQSCQLRNKIGRGAGKACDSYCRTVTRTESATANVAVAVRWAYATMSYVPAASSSTTRLNEASANV